jgi:hypothetical protein
MKTDSHIFLLKIYKFRSPTFLADIFFSAPIDGNDSVTSRFCDLDAKMTEASSRTENYNRVTLSVKFFEFGDGGV